jgi:amphi-Trp domain-containing protein
MTGMDIFEDARMVSRADLAAWLRQMADQLESSGKIFYGAAGVVTVANQVHCEFEIEQEKDGTEFSVEIEFTWAAEVTAATDGSADSKDDDEEAEKEEAQEGDKAKAAKTETDTATADDAAASATSADADADPAAKE